MAHINTWYVPPFTSGGISEVEPTGNSMQYPVLPDHVLQSGMTQTTASWGSPAESMFSDFSYPLGSPTPPPSPSLPKHSFEYEGEKSMRSPNLKEHQASQEPSKKRVSKRPARLSHPEHSSFTRQESEEKQSSPGSPESIELKTEKTPAQKMRRLLQNRTSQRNFRQRQASRRQKLEEQVEELQKRNKMYEDLLIKYEQMLRASSEANRPAMNSGSGEFRDFGLFQ